MSNLAFSHSNKYDFSATSFYGTDSAVVEIPDFSRGDTFISDSLDSDIDTTIHKANTDASDLAQEKATINVEDEFYCVIYAVDGEGETISARVYDPKVNVEVMDIDAPFANFDAQDQRLIKENAVFYWRIGTETKHRMNKKGKLASSTKNFSKFTMRRLYTSKRFYQEKINEQIKNFDSVFSD